MIELPPVRGQDTCTTYTHTRVQLANTQLGPLRACRRCSRHPTYLDLVLQSPPRSVDGVHGPLLLVVPGQVQRSDAAARTTCAAGPAAWPGGEEDGGMDGRVDPQPVQLARALALVPVSELARRPEGRMVGTVGRRQMHHVHGHS